MLVWGGQKGDESESQRRRTVGLSIQDCLGSRTEELRRMNQMKAVQHGTAWWGWEKEESLIKVG